MRGELYAQYVNSTAPSAAVHLLKGLPPAELEGSDAEALADNLMGRFALEPLDLERVEMVSPPRLRDPENTRSPLVVGIRVPDVDARYWVMIPSSRSTTPELDVRDGVVSFLVAGAQDIEPTYHRIKENWAALNKDIRTQRGRLREHLLNVSRGAIDEASKDMATERRRLDELRALGVALPGSADGPEGPGERSADLPTGLLFPLISNPANQQIAMDLLRRLREMAQTALDTGDLNEAGLILIEDEMLPLLDRLQGLIGVGARDLATRALRVEQTKEELGRVKQVASDVRAVMRAGADAARDLSAIGDLSESATNAADAITGLIG